MNSLHVGFLVAFLILQVCYGDPTCNIPGLCKVGLSICYDVRFPELYRHLVGAGADLLMIPAAFTAFTGKDHWQVLLQARAIENTAYVLAPAQTGVHHGRRQSHGHALVIDPWGTVLADAGVQAGNPERCFGLLDPRQGRHHLRVQVPIAPTKHWHLWVSRC